MSTISTRADNYVRRYLARRGTPVAPAPTVEEQREQVQKQANIETVYQRLLRRTMRKGVQNAPGR